jgi:hypothetical protein
MDNLDELIKQGGSTLNAVLKDREAHNLLLKNKYYMLAINGLDISTQNQRQEIEAKTKIQEHTNRSLLRHLTEHINKSTNFRKLQESSLSEANQVKSLAAVIFCEKLDQLFKKEGSRLENALQDPNTRELLMKKKLIKEAVEEREKQEELNKFESKFQNEVAKALRDEEEQKKVQRRKKRLVKY